MAPKKGSLEVHGNQVTMNLNEILYTNIMESRYFKQNLYDLKTYHEVVDEIYNAVTDLEPFLPNDTAPSSAFCLMYKLFTMKVTEKQMHGILNHQDSPYIRGVGFLYLRYCCPPKHLWDWFEPFLDDDEPLKAGWGKNSPEITIGQYVRQLLTEQRYFKTMLPRIPVPIERDIKAKMAEHDKANIHLDVPEPAAPGSREVSRGRDEERHREEFERERDWVRREEADRHASRSREVSNDRRGDSRDRSRYDDRDGRERSRDYRDRDRERDRDRNRDRDRDKDRDRDRGRDRDRNRDGEGARSRESERAERERSKERDRREYDRRDRDRK